MRKVPRAKKLAAKTRDSNSDVAGPQQGIYRLPVELLNLVLHNVWEDKRTIVACSQVSRLWHDVAQPHLFAFIKIASTHEFVRFHAFLHANVDITRHVRKLHLKIASRPRTDRSQHRDHPPAVGRAQLRDLVALLPRLQELHLYDLWVLTSPNPAPDAPDPEPTRSLESLTIEHRCTVEDLHVSPITVLNLVSLFTSVDTLELLSMHIPDFPPFDSTRLIRTVNVGTVVVRDFSLPPDFDVGVLYNALRELLSPGCLRSLHLGCLRAFFNSRFMTDSTARAPEGLRSLGRLVESAARNATHMHLPFRVSGPVGLGEDDPEYWRVLNLHACTSLTSLTLEIGVPPARVPAGAMYMPRVPLAQVCIALLANIPATVRVLTIKLWGVREQAQIKSAKTLGLRVLDTALAERHAHLERVEVMLDGPRSLSMLESSLALTRAMPKLRAKGVLAVVDWVD